MRKLTFRDKLGNSVEPCDFPDDQEFRKVWDICDISTETGRVCQPLGAWMSDYLGKQRDEEGV